MLFLCDMFVSSYNNRNSLTADGYYVVERFVILYKTKCFASVHPICLFVVYKPMFANTKASADSFSTLPTRQFVGNILIYRHRSKGGVVVIRLLFNCQPVSTPLSVMSNFVTKLEISRLFLSIKMVYVVSKTKKCNVCENTLQSVIKILLQPIIAHFVSYMQLCDLHTNNKIVVDKQSVQLHAECIEIDLIHLIFSYSI